VPETTDIWFSFCLFFEKRDVRGLKRQQTVLCEAPERAVPPTCAPRRKKCEHKRAYQGPPDFLSEYCLRVSRSRKDIERKRAYQGGAAAPSKAGTRKRPSLPFFCLKTKIIRKKTRRRLDFHQRKGIVLIGIDFRIAGNSISCSFHRLFQQKMMKTGQV
jgi:hypothetical protein